MSKVNVGDVTGQRWVGGATNPDTRDAEVEALRAEYRYEAERAIALEEAIDEKSAEAASVRKSHREAVKRLQALSAERDALRAQLDSMTWPPTLYQDMKTARYYASHPFLGNEEYEHTVVTRRTLTGAWTAVEGDN